MAQPEIPQESGKSEANNQVILGKLLQKERSADKFAQVEQILQSSISLEEKIRQIETLDNVRDQNSSYLSRKDFIQSAEASDNQDDQRKKREKPLLRKYHQARRHLKPVIKPRAFWRYLFYESGNIRRFCRQKHLFALKLFSGQAVISHSLLKYFGNTFQQCCLALIPALGQILQHGWLFLSKKEYNLMALLSGFVRKCIQTSFTHMNYKNRDFIDRLKYSESLYLSLLAIPERQELIDSAILQAGTRLKDFTAEFPDIHSNIDMLLREDITLPSFYNFILAGNMIKYRRTLDMKDLISGEHDDLISCEDWDCSEEVFDRIQGHMEGLELELVPLVKYYSETSRKLEYIPVDNNNYPDLNLLSKTWDRYYGDGEFKKDSGNISRFVMKYCKLFLDQYTQLLNGKITDNEGTERRIFTEQVFSGEISRIVNAFDKIELNLKIMPTFPRNRFLKLRQSRRGQIPNEAAMMQIVDIVVSASTNICDQLILAMSKGKTGTTGKDSQKAIDSLMIKQGKFSLPFANSIIKSPGILSGQTVGDALRNTIALFLSAAIHLDDPDTASVVKREIKQKQAIRRISIELQRLSDQEKFNRISTENNLADLHLLLS